MTDRAILDRSTRATALQELQREQFDVLVIGGGITGAGVALDAASRGLRTALVEADDLASGTSRWSSKLAHGGLRYLATGHVRIAKESADERHLLMTTVAPHLARPRRNLLPLTPDLPGPAGYLSAFGPVAADLLRRRAGTASHLLPAPKLLSAKRTRPLMPAWRGAEVRGAVSFWDGQFEDDARLVVDVARTAAAHGARVATYLRAESIEATSAVLHDVLTGHSFTARAQVVVNATGAWADGLDDRVRLAPSRGSHLVLPAARFGRPTCAINLPVPGQFGRFVFVLPRPDDLVIVGLTDDSAPGVDPRAPRVPAQDEEFLLGVVGRHLAQPVDRADVVGRFAGLRPLVVGADAGQRTADISREHLLVDEPGAPITIVGGKLTTYRRMAQDTVDAVARRIPGAGPCLTDRLPLVGAASAPLLRRVRAPRRLVDRYGTLAAQVQQLIASDPALGEPVVAGSPTVRAELAYGVLAEGGLTPEDLVERRTRITMREGLRDESLRVASELIERYGRTVRA